MTAIQPIVIRKEAARDPRVLWEGRPAWRSAAADLFRIRWISLYFCGLILYAAVEAGLKGLPLPLALAALAGLSLSGMAVLGLVMLAAWLVQRTSRYTLTETHLQMCFGIALPATLSIPLAVIEDVALRVRPDHSGDIVIRAGAERIPLHRLFPHCRPWSFQRPQPMLRSVPRAATVGVLLARAVRDARAAGRDAQSIATT
ncbi:MAG TPA: photosynthetic complex putative assembly protein PuhB [Acetobacteraceae bacterium]|nr:photosynthetic complex putative assembly protein PuhB [Acetobacteraceae bacterium]